MRLSYQDFVEGLVQVFPIETREAQTIAQIADAIRSVLEKVDIPGGIATYITNEICSFESLFVYPEKLLR